jgi:hypothetical protein
MTPARKRLTLFGAACGVWLAGLASAATLAYVFDGGSFRHLAAMLPVRGMPLGRAAVVEVVGESEADPMLPAADRYRFAPLAVAPAVPEPPLPVSKDISAMTCSDWQPLQAGSGRVQVCE